MGAALFQADLFQNVSHRISHCRCGRQRQVHNAEGNSQPLAGHSTHQLTHPGDFKSGLFDNIRHFRNGSVLGFGQSSPYHAGAGNPYVNDAVCFSYTVERPCHKGVVLRSVAEHHQFGGADAVAVLGGFGGIPHHLAHELAGVQVDSRFSGADIYRRADVIGFRQSLGNGTDQLLISGRKTFLHQCRVTPDEVYPAVYCGLFQHMGVFDGLTRRGADNGDGGDGNPLVDNGNPVFLFNLFPHLHQFAGLLHDFIVNLPAGGIRVRIDAIQQRDAHGNGADVQVFFLDHVDGFHDVLGIEHGSHSPFFAW